MSLRQLVNPEVFMGSLEALCSQENTGTSLRENTVRLLILEELWGSKLHLNAFSPPHAFLSLNKKLGIAKMPSKINLFFFCLTNSNDTACINLVETRSMKPYHRREWHHKQQEKHRQSTLSDLNLTLKQGLLNSVHC